MAQMSQTEVAQLLLKIGALQDDLLRLAPLFKGEDQVEAVTHTQFLLKILNDKMYQILATKHIDTSTDDDALVHRLLSKIQLNKRDLIWTGADEAE